MTLISASSLASLPASFSLGLSAERTELSEFIFRIIHNWGCHFVRARRHELDEMDQTALLSANSIAAKFEFEIRRELTVLIGRNNFSARINRVRPDIFEKCALAPSRANLVVKFARKILSRRADVKIKRSRAKLDIAIALRGVNS